MLRFDRKQQSSVKQLSFNLKKKKKVTPLISINFSVEAETKDRRSQLKERSGALGGENVQRKRFMKWSNPHELSCVLQESCR